MVDIRIDTTGRLNVGTGLKSLFVEGQFQRGDIVYMDNNKHTYLFEILKDGNGSFGYDVQYLINTRHPLNVFATDWVGPLTLSAYNAHKIL